MNNGVSLKNHIKAQLEFYNSYRHNLSVCCDTLVVWVILTGSRILGED